MISRFIHWSHVHSLTRSPSTILTSFHFPAPLLPLLTSLILFSMGATATPSISSLGVWQEGRRALGGVGTQRDGVVASAVHSHSSLLLLLFLLLLRLRLLPLPLLLLLLMI